MSLKTKSVEIAERRKLRDPAIGGYASLCVGPPGTGKTSLLLHEAKLFMKLYPEELLFWRDSPDSIAQYNRIGKNWQVLVEKGIDIRFHNLSEGGFLKIPYKTFKTIDDIVDQDTRKGLVRKGMINVIYFKNEYDWIDLLCHLRHTVGWQSVFIDEVEDIIPLNPSKREGEQKNFRMEKNLQFSNSAKQIRKGLVNLISDTQAYYEIDWRFKSKLTFMCYLRGSKVDNESRINQGAIDKLLLGDAFVDMEHRIYGKLKFPGFPPRYPLFEPIISY